MADTYGVVLVKGNTYTYKGVRFRNRVPAEVDLAVRDHLVGTGHFRDTNFEQQDPKPIPVRKRGKVRVRGPAKAKNTEPGMASADGGATATGGDDFEGAEPL